MSTLAIWLFIAAAVLLVVAVVGVVLAARSTVRKGKALAQEMDGLSADLDSTVVSPRRENSEH